MQKYDIKSGNVTFRNFFLLVLLISADALFIAKERLLKKLDQKFCRPKCIFHYYIPAIDNFRTSLYLKFTRYHRFIFLYTP